MVRLPFPSPKLQPPASARRQHWYRFYAMFSEAFAQHIVTSAALPTNATILDPWLGAGTTTTVAASAGFRSIGVDINPVMATISRGRALSRDAATVCEATLHGALVSASPQFAIEEDPLSAWFKKRAAASIRQYERTIRAAYDESLSPLEAGYLLTILFDAATELARPYRSKNPTWLKRPSNEARIDATHLQIKRLIEAAARRRIQLCAEYAPKHSPLIRTGTSTRLDVADASVDLTLTSPPYCTRIDYAVGTAIELAVLGLGTPTVRALRDGTMGTSTIRDVAPNVSPDWGRTCRRLLAKIASHPSKSSLNYYYKGYLQYFDDLFRSVQEIGRCSKPSGQIVIVVQDSVYKGIPVELPKIVTEMGLRFGWSLAKQADFAIHTNMRRLNTRSRAYLSDMSSTETVLCFTNSG